MGSTGDERFGTGCHRNQAFGSCPTGKGLPKNGVTSDSGRIRARSQTLNPKYIPSHGASEFKNLRANASWARAPSYAGPPAWASELEALDLMRALPF